jgi:UDP-GlcNAc3NAcA epimerase
MKIITIVGARPQFIKAAMVSRAIAGHNRRGHSPIEEQILHTGQHYDENMSGIFFDDMDIPRPAWELPCGESSHGGMTGRMLAEIEKILLDVRPDRALVYGDTNSTLAGALAAAKLHIPVAHVEAGLRSFNKQMPEEINRILTDHVSSLLLCPTLTAVHNLANEGIDDGVHHVGDVMYDAALLFGARAEASSGILRHLGIEDRPFRLCTVHRAENTDSRERLSSIFEALAECAAETFPVVVPLHPRTRRCLESYGLLAQAERHPGILLTPPLGYLDMTLLEKRAVTILTDSGGVQKEAYFHRTPCITLRDETEWIETVESGWNRIAGWQAARILRCIQQSRPATQEIDEYGTGCAAALITRLLG